MILTFLLLVNMILTIIGLLVFAHHLLLNGNIIFRRKPTGIDHIQEILDAQKGKLKEAITEKEEEPKE